MKRIIFILMILVGCKEAYQPDIKKSQLNYLVVEANITANGDSTFVYLSRTRLVSDTNYRVPENDATVNIEGENGDQHLLTQTADGVYAAPPSATSTGNKYRLNIQTADGNSYASDFVSLINTPAIDSVSWKQDENKNVHIYVSTHDAQSNTNYYRWEFTETWEHRATYDSYLIYDASINDLRNRDSNEMVYRCWNINPSTNILVANSAGLSSDIINAQPLTEIPYANEKLDFVYSIAVRQYALTKEGFEYWTNLKKNTEQLGSIFDPQPSSDNGNIHCITDLQKPVIGYVTASTVQQKRIYIYRINVGPWPYPVMACSDTTVPIKTFDEALHFVYYPVSLGDPPTLVFASAPDCVDCTLSGGTNIKPFYMP